jgi:hypothetical protein
LPSSASASWSWPARLHRPAGQGGLQVVHAQPRQQPPVERAGRRQEAQVREVPPQQSALFAAPLAHRIHRVAVTQDRRHQAGQQEGQVIATAMPRAGIRHRGERRGQVPQRAIRQRRTAVCRAHGSQYRRHLGRLHLTGSLCWYFIRRNLNIPADQDLSFFFFDQ